MLYTSMNHPLKEKIDFQIGRQSSNPSALLNDLTLEKLEKLHLNPSSPKDFPKSLPELPKLPERKEKKSSSPAFWGSPKPTRERKLDTKYPHSSFQKRKKVSFKSFGTIIQVPRDRMFDNAHIWDLNVDVAPIMFDRQESSATDIDEGSGSFLERQSTRDQLI